MKAKKRRTEITKKSYGKGWEKKNATLQSRWWGTGFGPSWTILLTQSTDDQLFVLHYWRQPDLIRGLEIFDNTMTHRHSDTHTKSPIDINLGNSRDSQKPVCIMELPLQHVYFITLSEYLFQSQYQPIWTLLGSVLGLIFMVG